MTVKRLHPRRHGQGDTQAIPKQENLYHSEKVKIPEGNVRRVKARASILRLRR